MSWTDERVELLKRLWSDGLSASQIAAELGGITRNAVIGNTALAHAYDYEAEATPELIDNIIPIGQRRSLLELTELTCRWPIGDPGSSEFFFCGGNSLTGLPYCAYHSRIAHQPASERRRERRPLR
jgi:GcrA cell cycle regulator